MRSPGNEIITIYLKDPTQNLHQESPYTAISTPTTSDTCTLNHVIITDNRYYLRILGDYLDYDLYVSVNGKEIGKYSRFARLNGDPFYQIIFPGYANGDGKIKIYYDGPSLDSTPKILLNLKNGQ